MKYVALFRGINVGGKRKVEMKKLKQLFEDLGLEKVMTYLNSGNVIFESKENIKTIDKKIKGEMERQFGEDYLVLVKEVEELRNIVKNLPKEWQNNTKEKTDVAYLFEEIDDESIVGKLPIKKEYLEIKYVKGAVIWRVKRENYNKSQLGKIIGTKIYQLMTVRNINTARFLSNL